MSISRTAIFIDGAYLEKVQQHLAIYNLDFGRLVESLVPEQSSLLRAYYYHSLPFLDRDAGEEERLKVENRRRFFHALNMKAGITVREGRVKRGYDSNDEPYYIQKQVDTLLVLDLAKLSMKHLIDAAVIVSGDSDFKPVAELAKEEGVRVTVWHAQNESRANSLLIAADERYALDEELLESCVDEERHEDHRMELNYRTDRVPAPGRASVADEGDEEPEERPSRTAQFLEASAWND